MDRRKNVKGKVKDRKKNMIKMEERKKKPKTNGWREDGKWGERKKRIEKRKENG